MSIAPARKCGLGQDPTAACCIAAPTYAAGLCTTFGQRSSIDIIHYLCQIDDSLFQLRFYLCSVTVFSRTDTVTDSEAFYFSIMNLLDDPEEEEEVKDLLLFWNQYV